MKLETLFEKFDQFADAPDAVAKMRELVLELAVTGRLVAQDNHDEPASSLLESTEAERAKLVAAKRIKARPTVPIEPDEQPYELPSGWAWANLSDVGYELGQKVPDKRFTYIDVGGIDSEKGRISDRVEKFEPGDAPSRARKLVARGTVIYSTVRPYLLNIAIVDQDFEPEPIASTAFGILHPFAGINNRYLFYWLRSAPFTAYVQAGMKGMAYPAINDEKFYSGPIALPPLAEQKRIVAKVDELMALCDRLEALETERESRHGGIARASLARFADAPTSANLHFIFHKSYHIPPADLRKSILALAVQGKLVPQDPNDEPAEKLWKKVERERRIYAEENRFRIHLDSEVEAEPFELPTSWKWVRLASLFNVVTDGDHLPPPKSESGVAFLTIGNITTGKLEFEGCRFVPSSYFEALAPFRQPSRGDILYTIVGATYGRPALVEGNRPFCVQRHIAILKPTASMDVGFLLSVLKSPLCYDQASRSTTGTAQPTIPLSALRNFVVPLPPLAEQRRIVAKVEQLMALVDALDTQLAASRVTAANLLSALVAELTALPLKQGDKIEYRPGGEFLRAVKNGLEKGFEAQWHTQRSGFEDTTEAMVLREDSTTYGWSFGMTREFQKQVDSIDRKLQGRILQAITDITSDPVTPKGDTVKRLTGDWKDYWRYRIGDFRLVYFPELSARRVTLWAFAPRGGVYE